MPLRSERRPGAVDLMQVEHVGVMYPQDMPSSTETPLGNTLLLTMPPEQQSLDCRMMRR